MSHVIIFGCGGVGIQVKNQLEAEGNEIVCFADNNSTKWGVCCEGKKVIPPQEIVQKRFDYIAIGIFKAADVVRQQLHELGIADERIIMPIQPDKIFPYKGEVSPDKLRSLVRSEYTSKNTKKYQELNIKIKDQKFLQNLEKLKNVLIENHIPREKICVVSGAVLQAFGIRESKEFDDIDIIMTSDLRKVYGSGLVIISDIAEMHVQNQYPISDDEIICNGEYHFVFSDLKFMHPRILYEYGRKTKSKEYELLESYCNFSERNHI